MRSYCAGDGVFYVAHLDVDATLAFGRLAHVRANRVAPPLREEPPRGLVEQVLEHRVQLAARAQHALAQRRTRLAAGSAPLLEQREPLVS